MGSRKSKSTIHFEKDRNVYRELMIRKKGHRKLKERNILEKRLEMNTENSLKSLQYVEKGTENIKMTIGSLKMGTVNSNSKRHRKFNKIFKKRRKGHKKHENRHSYHKMV